jgi:hypothetical protein
MARCLAYNINRIEAACELKYPKRSFSPFTIFTKQTQTLPTLQSLLDDENDNSTYCDFLSIKSTALEACIKMHNSKQSAVLVYAREIDSLCNDVDDPATTLVDAEFQSEVNEEPAQYDPKTCHLVGISPGFNLGIFTTKDLVLRVIADKLHPETLLERVMTPTPDYVTPETSIIACLKKMQSKHYNLNFRTQLFASSYTSFKWHCRWNGGYAKTYLYHPQ